MKELKFNWSWYGIQNFCIEKHLYTYGTLEEFNALSDFVSEHECNPENIYKVCDDIFKHSDPEELDCDAGYAWDYILEELFKNVIEPYWGRLYD